MNQAEIKELRRRVEKLADRKMAIRAFGSKDPIMLAYWDRWEAVLDQAYEGIEISDKDREKHEKAVAAAIEKYPEVAGLEENLEKEYGEEARRKKDKRGDDGLIVVLDEVPGIHEHKFGKKRKTKLEKEPQKTGAFVPPQYRDRGQGEHS